MPFELLCMGMIALLFGLALVFSGYRMLWIILPIWGFFFGFGLGAQTLEILLGVGFLATITSWVVGFIVGAIFAVLSYLFYMVAVALISGAFGYALAVGLLLAIGLDYNFLVWIIGIVAGVVAVVVVLRFNIQKYAIIVAVFAKEQQGLTDHINKSCILFCSLWYDVLGYCINCIPYIVRVHGHARRCISGLLCYEPD